MDRISRSSEKNRIPISTISFVLLSDKMIKLSLLSKNVNCDQVYCVASLWRNWIWDGKMGTLGVTLKFMEHIKLSHFPIDFPSISFYVFFWCKKPITGDEHSTSQFQNVNGFFRTFVVFSTSDVIKTMSATDFLHCRFLCFSFRLYIL